MTAADVVNGNLLLLLLQKSLKWRSRWPKRELALALAGSFLRSQADWMHTVLENKAHTQQGRWETC